MTELPAHDLPVFAAGEKIALFLDFDGTLVDFADHPDEVMLDPQTRACIESLYERLDGALAIVTGRDIAVVDRFLAPYRLPVAGVHGLVRRDAEGRVHEAPVDANALTQLAAELDKFAKRHQGLLVEHKPGAVALHYRQRPDMAEACCDAVEQLAEKLGGITLLRGKSVIEARANGADKGRAILTFLNEAPFAARRPVFAGDDITDEDGFARVNALGGVTIKVGGGQSCARHRAPTIAIFRRWLCRTAAHYQERDGE